MYIETRQLILLAEAVLPLKALGEGSGDPVRNSTDKRVNRNVFVHRGKEQFFEYL